MARTKQPARKREQPEEEEKKNEENKEGDVAGQPHDGNKRRRTSQQGETREEAEEYTLGWSQFGEFMNRPSSVVGVTPAVLVCDEPVDEALAEVGRQLLDSLGSSSSAAGPWHEDVDAGRARAEQVATSMSEPSEAVKARVYRASLSGRPDCFELTHLKCQDQLEYVFVVDKPARRFVFVGECSSLPHAGTNDFIYDNSWRSGPGLLPDPSLPPTPTTLLAAAKQRFSEFCLNHCPSE